MINEIKEFLHSIVHTSFVASGDFIDDNGEWQRGTVWAHPDFTITEIESDGNTTIKYHGQTYSQEQFLKIIKLKAFW